MNFVRNFRWEVKDGKTHITMYNDPQYIRDINGEWIDLEVEYADVIELIRTYVNEEDIDPALLPRYIEYRDTRDAFYLSGELPNIIVDTDNPDILDAWTRNDSIRDIEQANGIQYPRECIWVDGAPDITGIIILPHDDYDKVYTMNDDGTLTYLDEYTEGMERPYYIKENGKTYMYVNHFSGGAGTQADPYRINTPADFDNIRNNRSAWYKFMNDIDMTGYPIQPIADSGTFSGTVDGNGYSLINVVVNYTRTSATYSGIASIFGKGASATIRNLKIVNPTITAVGNSVSKSGIVFGASYPGCTLDSVAIEGGSLTALVNCGSLFGEFYTGANTWTVTNCYSTATINGTSNIGGMFGYSRDTYSKISNCYFAGDVNASISGGYGFTGVRYSGTFNNCFWDTQTSGAATDASGSTAVGKTTAQMQTQSTFTGWNFSTIWVMSGYPELQLFVTETPGSATLTINENVIAMNPGSSTLHISQNVLATGGSTLSINQRITAAGSLTLPINQRVTVVDSSILPINVVVQDGGSSTLPLNEKIFVSDYSLLPSNENIILGGSEFIDMIEHVSQGTEADPHHIKTPADLSKIINDTSAYYVLDNDINMQGVSYSQPGIFRGTLDGRGYSIQNLAARLVGTSLKDGTIKNLALIDINIVTNTNARFGAFAPMTEGAANITNCYATGYIENSNTGTTNVLGGIIGVHQGGTISNCYSLVHVKGAYRVAGFVGAITSGTVDKCYSAGKVEKTGSGLAYGFSGSSSGITNCYWDTQTSTQATSIGGTGKTTAQMKTQATFTGYDFANTWIMYGNRYPSLRTQSNAYSLLSLTEKVALGGSTTLSQVERVLTTASSTLPMNSNILKNEEIKMQERILTTDSSSINMLEMVKIADFNTVAMIERAIDADVTITDFPVAQSASNYSLYLDEAQWLCVDPSINRVANLLKTMTLQAGRMMYLERMVTSQNTSMSPQSTVLLVRQYEADGTTLIRTLYTSSLISYPGEGISPQYAEIGMVIPGLDRDTVIKAVSSNANILFDLYGSASDLSIENVDSKYEMSVNYPVGTGLFQFNYTSNYGKSHITTEASLDNGGTWFAIAENETVLRNISYSNVKLRFKANVAVSTPISINAVRFNFENRPSASLAMLERVKTTASATLPLNERTVKGAYQLLTASEMVKKPESTTLQSTERTLGRASAILAANEFVMYEGSATLPIIERAKITGTAFYLPIVEEITDNIRGNSTIIATELIHAAGSSTVQLKERAIIADVKTLIVNEKVIATGSYTIGMTEVIKKIIHEDATLAASERILDAKIASIVSSEKVWNGDSKTLNVVEFIDSDTVDKIAVRESIYDAASQTLTIHEYVSDESLNVLVRRALFKKLTQ